MKIGVPKERREFERRVATTPETAARFVAMGFEVTVERDAGAGAAFPDEAYIEAGAIVVADEAAALGEADIVLKVQRPGSEDELGMIKPGAALIGLLDPTVDREYFAACARARIDTMALEYLPRISRAQSMDALSSQSNLAGYKAVLDAAAEFGRAFPMMMTAAGTVAPARVFVLGAGVAGLQAIATARRLGAIVSSFDVRPEVQEQVESLGARFVAMPIEGHGAAAADGGYAREMSADFQKRQAEVTHQTLKTQDIVICTALIPGRPAPMLVAEEMVRGMKPGSVIVDLAVESGGNCALSRPGEVVHAHGVSIVGHRNVPSRIAVDASALYAKNLLNLLTALYDAESGSLKIDRDDEIVNGILLTHDGAIVHPSLTDHCGASE
jgi:NAD(P) transhydrogenase subunit alpha